MKYTVALSTHAGTVVEIEATTAYEARTKAEEEAYVSLCHQCEHQVGVGDDWRASEVLDDQGRTAWNDTDYGPDVVTMCPRGHGLLENGDCPDCGSTT